MGSIPLPALDVKTPQQPDLLDNYGRLMQLKNMKQQTQLQQQEAPLRMQALQQGVQKGGIDLQQAQQDQQDQQSFRAIMQDPSMKGKTISDAADALAQRGQISPKGYEAAKKADLETRTSLAKLDESTLANQKAAHTATGELYNNVMNMPDDQLAANWPQIAQQYDAIPGNNKQPLDPNKPLTKQQLAQFGPAISLANSYFDQELARRTKQTELQNDQLKPQQAAATAAETARHNKADEAAARGRLSIEGARLNFEKQKEANATGNTPEGAGLVDSIGTGKIAVDRLGYLVTKNPGLLEAVSQKYPDFDSSKAGAYVQAYKDFTSTKTNTAGGALNSGATALGHLKELKDMNTVASHIPGTPAYNAYMNKVDTVATELAKFYGDSTVSGIETIKKTLSSTLPGNRDAAIATQAQSMGDKFDAYQQSWDNAAPSKAYQAPMPGISEKAQEARAALDPNFHAAQVTKATKASAPAPQTHAFSLSAWQKANPQGDPKAAAAAAQQAGYQVTQ